jgi:hypothetical protein
MDKSIFLDDKDQYFLEVDFYFLIALDQWIDRSSQNVVGGWEVVRTLFSV